MYKIENMAVPVGTPSVRRLSVKIGEILFSKCRGISHPGYWTIRPKTSKKLLILAPKITICQVPLSFP